MFALSGGPQQRQRQAAPGSPQKHSLQCLREHSLHGVSEPPRMQQIAHLWIGHSSRLAMQSRRQRHRLTHHGSSSAPVLVGRSAQSRQYLHDYKGQLVNGTVRGLV